ncbi:unnamed protein product, partial [Polarella glacialis]
ECTLPGCGSYGDYFGSCWKLNQSDLQFEDGTVPSPDVLDKFASIVASCEAESVSAQEDSTCHEAKRVAVVVHCTAGLGRTMTLLGAWVVETYGISGGAWLGWARMSRPGSVNTEVQERFLKSIKAVALPSPKVKYPGSFAATLFSRFCSNFTTADLQASPRPDLRLTRLATPDSDRSSSDKNDEESEKIRSKVRYVTPVAQRPVVLLPLQFKPGPRTMVSIFEDVKSYPGCEEEDLARIAACRKKHLVLV